MSFIESDERKALREAVVAMASKFGQDYFLEKARAGQHTDELWAEAGKHGCAPAEVPALAAMLSGEAEASVRREVVEELGRVAPQAVGGEVRPRLVDGRGLESAPLLPTPLYPRGIGIRIRRGRRRIIRYYQKQICSWI